MNKIVTALVALVLLANSNGYAWDVPDEVGGGGAAYYDLDYGFNPQQYEAFVFDDNLYLFELGFTGPNWPDKEDQFGDIIPRDIFRDLINQCAGFGGPYTCQDFTRLVNKCADGVQCSEEEHQANRRSEFIITAL